MGRGRPAKAAERGSWPSLYKLGNALSFFSNKDRFCPPSLEGLSKEELGKVQYLHWFMENMGAYNKLQSTQPQTLFHALADSPVGQLAWSAQLFGDAVSSDYILTNVMIYWLTNTAASSARF